MLLSGSIVSDNHNGPSKSFRSVRISSYKEFFLHMYGFILLRGSIVSDNHNGAIEKFEMRSNK